MSFLSRLWTFIRRPTGYVGKDLEGNIFYEYASSSSDPRRTRRVVKYQGKTDMLEVAERSRSLAVQWKAWLTHTRKDPPTLAEIRADLDRRQRVLANVAVIAEREREERLRLTNSRARNTIAGPEPPEPPEVNVSECDRNGGISPARPQDSVRKESNPWVPPPASDEPESWSPKAVRRRG